MGVCKVPVTAGGRQLFEGQAQGVPVGLDQLGDTVP